MFKKGVSGNPTGKPKGAVSQERKFKTWLFKLFLDHKEVAEGKIIAMLETNSDLKWLINILASMSPKEIEHSGDGLKSEMRATFVYLDPKAKEENARDNRIATELSAK